jgi:hypothetical protein
MHTIFLLGNPEGKIPLRIHRCSRWVDNIEMDIVEIGWDGGGWIHVAHYSDPSGRLL